MLEKSAHPRNAQPMPWRLGGFAMATEGTIVSIALCTYPKRNQNLLSTANHLQASVLTSADLAPGVPAGAALGAKYFGDVEMKGGVSTRSMSHVRAGERGRLLHGMLASHPMHLLLPPTHMTPLLTPL